MNSRYNTLLAKGILFSGLFLLSPSQIYASNGYAGGSGTEQDPYLISTAEQLNQLQLDVNVNSTSTAGKHYRLTNNINLSNYDNDSNPDNGNLTPIGRVPDSSNFGGTFDGNGYSISNLEINLPSEDYVGLFGSTHGIIKNLGLENVTISGKSYVGGLVGRQLSGTVSQCYVTGNVSGSGYVGGLVAAQHANGLITQTYSKVNVNNGVGGHLLGLQHSGEVSQSYSIGGLVGEQSLWEPDIEQQTISNSYWDKTSGNSVGGTGLTTSQITGINAETNMSGFDFDRVWEITDGYPKFKWEKASTSSTSSEKVIQVTGEVLPLVASITVPTETLSFVIDPNQEAGKQFIAPEFSVTNDTHAPLKLEIKSFTQLTSEMNDVLPSKYSDWDVLNKTESNDIALAVVPQKGDGWKSLTEGARYVADDSNYELGVINPAETVNFKFSALHGRTIIKPISLSYELTLIFDFE